MLTSEETADLFGISMETLRMWQETGVLLPIKTEKNYMYSQSAIERFQEKYEGFDMSTPEGVNKAYNTLNINETKATIVVKCINELISEGKLYRHVDVYGGERTLSTKPFK